MSRNRRVLLQPFLFLAEEWNGIDEHLLQLCRHCDRNQWEFSLLVHNTDGPQTRTLAARAGLRVVSAPYTSGAGQAHRIAALRAMYAAERWDIVHLHSPSVAGMGPAALAARLAGISATIATYHQVQPYRYGWRTRAINRALYVGSIRSAIAVSEGVKTTAIANAGVPAQRITVIPNGVDMLATDGHRQALCEKDRDEVLIGYFGRLSPEKGVDILLDALRLLVDLTPRARAVIVGDGPEREELEAKAAGIGLGARVHFLGYRRDARALMSEVDIVVHVPRYEGQGLAVVEAMAAGKPVVTNDAPGGLREVVVHGETGIIVHSGSATKVANALARLAADPGERLRLGNNGRRRVENHFTAKAMAERTMAVYDG